MRIRLYFDEDAMDEDLVEALRARGIDIQTAFEAEMIEREDHEQLRHAATQERVVYTFNVGHFCVLHADFLNRGEDHAGIIIGQQQRYSIGAQMRRLLNLIAARTAEEMRNQLEFLGNWPELTEG